MIICRHRWVLRKLVCYNLQACRTAAMDQKPRVWMKNEETDEVPAESGSMFPEDPLKNEEPSVWVKQDSELKHHVDGSDLNFVEYPLGISWSTDFIKEDPELNVEVSGSENIIVIAVVCEGGISEEDNNQRDASSRK